MPSEIWSKNKDVIESGLLRTVVDDAFNEVGNELKVTYEDGFPLLNGLKLKPNNLFYLGFCESLSNATLDRLQKLGIASRKAEYIPKKGQRHSFVVFEENGVR